MTPAQRETGSNCRLDSFNQALTSSDEADTKLVVQVRNDDVVDSQLHSKTVSVCHRKDPGPECKMSTNSLLE